MPHPLPLAELVQLMEHRQQSSMRDVLHQLALLHGQIQGQGHELALEGHYRRAFHALQRHPRRLQGRMAGAFRFYLIALYAEQLYEPGAAAVHFATAYRELYGVIDLIHERYEDYSWLHFEECREMVAFFDAVTVMTPLGHQQRASLFYRQPYRLAEVLTDGIKDYLLKPLRMPQERRAWFPRRSPARHRLPTLLEPPTAPQNASPAKPFDLSPRR